MHSEAFAPSSTLNEQTMATSAYSPADITPPAHPTPSSTPKPGPSTMRINTTAPLSLVSFDDLDLDSASDPDDDEYGYEYDHASGVPEVNRRDRRIQRWLEQQCRFSLLFGEGGKGVLRDERERGGEDEEREERQVDGREGSVLRHDSMTTTATATTSSGSDPALTTSEERADSPVLGFGFGSTDSLPLRAEASSASDAGDALTRPARNFVRELPLEEEDVEDVGRTRFARSVRRERSAESVVSPGSRDKPLPTLPPPSTSTTPSLSPMPAAPPPTPAFLQIRPSSSNPNFLVPEPPATPTPTQPSSLNILHQPLQLQPQTQTPAQATSPLPASSAPTRRQSRVNLAFPTTHAHAQNLSVSSLASIPGVGGAGYGSGGRSRAGSVGLRHAVYINSEEVIERLDALLLRSPAEMRRLEVDDEEIGAEDDKTVLEELGLGLRDLDVEDASASASTEETFLGHGHEQRTPSTLGILDTLHEQMTPPPSAGAFETTFTPASPPAFAAPPPVSAPAVVGFGPGHSREGSGSSRRASPSGSSRPALSRSQSQSLAHVYSRASSREALVSAYTSTSASPSPLHSRSTSYSHSRSPSHSHSGHSHSHSVAHSQHSHSHSIIHAPHSQVYSSTASLVHSPKHSRSSSSVLLATPITPLTSISIPVPVQVAHLPVSAVRPTRPPPAPPLDLGIAQESEAVARGLGLVDLGSELFYGDALAEDGTGSAEGYLSSRGHEVVMMEKEMAREEEEDVDVEAEADEDPEQLLRVLQLGDRMHEFRGAHFPVEDAMVGEDAGGPYGLLEAAAHIASGEERQPRVLQRSMSRWSLTSSAAGEQSPPRSGAAGQGGEKKKLRTRKSFVSPFAATFHEPSTPGERERTTEDSTTPVGTPAVGKDVSGTPGSGEKKKRGRLASFISRLSGVGTAGNSSPNGSGSATPASPPPVPNLPAAAMSSPNLSSPLTPGFSYIDLVPPVPAVPVGALMPSPVIVDALPNKEKTIKEKRSKELLLAAAKEDLGPDVGVELAGSLRGVWDKPRERSSSIQGSPVGSMRLRSPTIPLPIGAGSSWTKPIAKAYSDGIIPATNEQQAPVSMASGMALGARPRASSAADLLRVSSGAPHSNSTPGSANGSAVNLHQHSGPSFNVNTSDMRRPALVKSASASVLGPYGLRMPSSSMQYRRTPMQIQTHMAPPSRSRPTIVLDDSMPPTPSSLASTEIDEGDEDAEEEDEDYGVENSEQERIRREREHDERWTELRSRQQQDLPQVPHSPPLTATSTSKKVDNVLGMLAPSHAYVPVQSPTVASGMVSAAEQRRRLKSMSSLGNLLPNSPPATASTTNFSLPSGKAGSKGFRGFVERMKLVSNSSGASSPASSSFPTTPLSVSIPTTSANSSADGLHAFPSPPPAASAFNRSPSHSPTTSFSATGKKNQPHRKLMISGVAISDVRGYEAVKAWCESVGAVREIMRADNDCLYVDFEDAGVAETVCRPQTQVFIKGAGNVALSWYSKKKPL